MAVELMMPQGASAWRLRSAPQSGLANGQSNEVWAWLQRPAEPTAVHYQHLGAFLGVRTGDPVFLLSASAAQVDPGLSKRCVRMGREEEAGISEGIESVKRPGGESPCLKGEQMGILNVIWLRREVLLDGTGCPAAVVIAAVMFMLHDIKFAFASRNNLEHEGLFHRLSRLQKEMLLGMGLSHQTDGSWPFSEAARAYTEIVQWLNERVAASRPQWDPEPVDTSDEAHTQALEDVSVILEEEGDGRNPRWVWDAPAVQGLVSLQWHLDRPAPPRPPLRPPGCGARRRGPRRGRPGGGHLCRGLANGTLEYPPQAGATWLGQLLFSHFGGCSKWRPEGRTGSGRPVALHQDESKNLTGHG
ncbi:unnamed protein product [Durusdinium trenchii]|uniref:Uncharacterized protein n=1 Tax=Durusdinium trenchii TaxID=1381693 RepID=A0ABP0S317_9DINO